MNLSSKSEAFQSKTGLLLTPLNSELQFAGHRLAWFFVDGGSTASVFQIVNLITLVSIFSEMPLEWPLKFIGNNTDKKNTVSGSV